MNCHALPYRALLAMVSLLLVVAARAQGDAASPPPQQQKAQEQQRFDILEFQVEGNTVLDGERIERAVYPFLGEAKSIADADGARAALEQAYRAMGYATVAVDIPPQKVMGGVVVLQVVEGRVAHLRVLGSRYFSQDRILAAMPALAEGSVPHLPAVQKQLVDANSSPDARITPLLRPGKQPGTTDVDLQVEDKLPLHGSVELNNHAAPNTSALRLLAGLRYANLFQRDHTLGLQIQTSPEDTSQVKVLAANYLMPAGGGTLMFSALRTVSSSFVGSGVGVYGTGSVLGARFVLPLDGGAASPGLNHSLTWGADYKDFQQSLSLTDGNALYTPIRYLPLSLNYAGQRADGANLTEFNAGLSFAIRGVASSDAEFADKRYRANSEFALIKLGLARTQKLAGGMSLFVRADAQGSLQPLVSNEQYVAGGVDSVRGYLESTASADNALRASIELRSAPLAQAGSMFDSLQWRAFVDAAYLRNVLPLPGSRAAFELLGVGAGIGLKAGLGIDLRADLAWPLRASNFQRAYGARLQASASYGF